MPNGSKEYWRRLGEHRLAGPILAALGLLVLVGLGLASYWRAPDAFEDGPGPVTFFQIGTGSVDSPYFAVGERLAGAISRPPGTPPCDRTGPCGVKGLVAVVKSSGGAAANIRAVEAHQFESALVPAIMLDLAYRGKEPFAGEKPYDGLRAIASVYRENVFVVASRGAHITSFEGLKNMRIAIGPKGSPLRETALRVLSAFGIGPKNAVLSDELPERAADLALFGQLDAFFMIGEPRAPLIRSLTDRGAVDIVPIMGPGLEKLGKTAPFLTPVTLPEGTFRLIPDIETLSTPLIFICDVNADPGLVEAITRALFYPGNHMLLSPPGMDNLLPGEGAEELRLAVAGLPIPLHPGAAAFFYEKGAISEPPSSQMPLARP